MSNLTAQPPIHSRIDLQRVADMIEPGSRVLDVGCGDGALLDYLVHHKQVDGRGIELSREGVARSVSLGLAVVQGDAETDLQNYPTDAFDYVVLSQILQSIFATCAAPCNSSCALAGTRSSVFPIWAIGAYAWT